METVLPPTPPVHPEAKRRHPDTRDDEVVLHCAACPVTEDGPWSHPAVAAHRALHFTGGMA